MEGGALSRNNFLHANGRQFEEQRQVTDDRCRPQPRAELLREMVNSGSLPSRGRGTGDLPFVSLPVASKWGYFTSR
jgi:hypothetical protein